PLLLNGAADADLRTRKKAVHTLSRLAALLVKNQQTTLLPLPLPPTIVTAKDWEDYQQTLEAYRKLLQGHLAALTRALEPVRSRPDVLRKAVTDRDPEIAQAALRMLEDFAILQNYIQERVFPLLQEREDEEAPASVTFFEPLFDKLRPELIRALSAPSDGVRLAAIQVFETRGAAARAAVPAVVERLDDTSLFVRWVAVRIL